MNHLVAYTGNEPELMACALFQARRALACTTPDESEGWGLGFVQGEEVLLRKSPRADSREIDFYSVSKALGADALIGGIGLGEDGVGAAENSDPFRFRSWLFSMGGHADGFELVRERLLQNIPDFLRRNIHGRSSSEHTFHLFLAFLHDAGLLEARSPDAGLVRHALSQSAAFLDRLLAGVGAATSKKALVVTNGRSLLAESRGFEIQYLQIAGVAECTCSACPARRDDSDQPRRIPHPDLRAVILEADRSLPSRPGWSRLPDGHTLLVDMDRSPTVVPRA